MNEADHIVQKEAKHEITEKDTQLKRTTNSTKMKFRDDIEIDSLENSRSTSPESFENSENFENSDQLLAYNESQQIACLKKVVEKLGKIGT